MDSVSEEEKLKNELAVDTKTIFHGLNQSQRLLFKACFGYIPVKDWKKSAKSKTQASEFVQKLLWPEKNDFGEEIQNVEKEEREEFDLHTYLTKLKSNEELQPFLLHNDGTMKQIFDKGRNFSQVEEENFLKTTQVRTKE